MTRGNGNILIVDDNADFRKALKGILLSKFPFIFISQAANGREAFLKLERHRPDLVFLDIDLPGESGLVIIKEMKAIFSHVVIIMLTHQDLPEYREAAYQNGAEYFLSKEATKVDEILTLVESILAVVKEIQRANNKRSTYGGPSNLMKHKC